MCNCNTCRVYCRKDKIGTSKIFLHKHTIRTVILNGKTSSKTIPVWPLKSRWKPRFRICHTHTWEEREDWTWTMMMQGGTETRLREGTHVHRVLFSSPVCLLAYFIVQEETDCIQKTRKYCYQQLRIRPTRKKKEKRKRMNEWKILSRVLCPAAD